MTRKARCGSTQKHTKMPGDATPWEELSRGIRTNAKSDAGPQNKIRKRNEEIEHITETEDSSTEFKKNNQSKCTINIKTEDSSTKIKKINQFECIVKKETENSSTEIMENNLLECALNNETKSENHNSFKDKGKIPNKKKLYYLKKLQQRRLENGVTLLSPNQERKIYLFKKRLRQKGLPPDVIRDATRKKRRAEEILFQKNFTYKICFNCRERGHLLSNCPNLRSTNQVTGICLKCGSTEHVSYKCQKKVTGYPLANCFVCKEQGHVSKDCPKNKNGVYIHGGCCKLCGSVNHLQKDCPTSKKKTKPVTSAYTIKEGTSIDAEIIEEARVAKKKRFKQPKIVKF